MTDIKSWIQSRTIWAILVSVAPTLTQLFGVDVDATLDDILTIAGAAAAIYFRFAAKSSLK